MNHDAAAIPSNARLVDRFRNRDASAFDELFRRHRDRVYRICLRALGHHQDAEDLTQETFGRFARSIHRWDSARPLEPWLAKIATNACRTFLSRRRGEVTGADWTQVVPAVSVDAVDEAGHLAGEMMLIGELRDVLGRLPPDAAHAFELIHQHGYSYQAVATQLGCPVGTVKTWVHRARLQLIDRLRDCEDVLP
ncbi:MAG: RNA polymerase sigma factor [Planctomycetota bacterium]